MLPAPTAAQVANAVWTRSSRVVTLASAVTVTTNNDKTGYSLTAASYAVTGSVQRGNIAITGTDGSNTASISAVTTTKTRCAYNGVQVDQTLNNNELARITLTNSTTVTATRQAPGSSMSSTAEYEVIPYV